MSDLEFVLDESPLDALLGTVKAGDRLSAARLLAVLGTESQSVLEEALTCLLDRGAELDVESLPPVSGDSETAARLRMESRFSGQAELMKNLDPSDPLSLYLEEIASIPVCGVLTLLAQELIRENTSDTGALSVRQRVMDLCLSRVVELACGFTGHGMLLVDLIQEGSMGLWEQLGSYPGGDLEQFCDRCIRWYMAKAVTLQAYAAGVGQKLRSAVEDYRSVDERLLAELGRNPTAEEMAQGLHMSVEETAAVARILENARTLQRTHKPEPETLPQEEDQAVEDTAYFQMRQRIAELLSALSEADAQLLRLRYGLDGGLPMKPEQVAQRLGITAQDVTARETAALQKLRAEH